ncbi:MAG: hypothetical protein RLP15_13075 [Cryomorphaceae bacterium]
MKKLVLFLFFPTLLISCGGASESDSTGANADDVEVQASDADLHTVEETKSIGDHAKEVNQDVDSILNTL